MIEFYDRIVLGHPRAILLVLFVFVVFCGYWIKDARLDASGEQLVLEHDDDVRYFREVSARYENVDFLFIAYTPPESLFSDAALNRLARLRDEFAGLDRVSSVVTLLDVPLLENPPGPLSDLKDNIKTLESPEADRELAVAEFRDSPIYQKLLVSPDLRSTAIQVNLSTDERHEELLFRRSMLRQKEYTDTITDDELGRLEVIESEYRRSQDRHREERHDDIMAVRAIIDRYRSEAQLFLGGAPMVVDDVISFIKHDLRVFGLGMFCFLVLTLGVIFRRLRWVVLPMLCCVTSGIVMTGLLGLSSWDITVVSSNFISLQLIFTMSLAIHIVVRYRECRRTLAGAGDRVLIREAVRLTFVPCLYACLTTMAGFASLVICDILPVVNFGWMMNLGLVVSLTVTFLLLPACLAVMRQAPPEGDRDFGAPVTSLFAHFTERHGPAIFAVSLVIAALTAVGITRLEVENSFIDYFKKSTEIYQGMEFIDRNLGGTTPLDIILDVAEDEKEAPVPAAADDAFGEFSEFEEEDDDPSKYWFTTDRLELIETLHDYIDGLPATGKVMSLATTWKTARELNEGKPLDDLAAALLYNSLSGDFRDLLVKPYASVERDQARLSTRIMDSMEGLRRDALIRSIRKNLTEKLGIEPDRFRITGVMLLYNNMLQSLFRSQIKTIGFTVLVLMVMFTVLFRSIRISLIAIFPNLLSSMLVLGLMGLLGIPLDVMTITIVAISIGIAVDNTIHYLHRFRREIVKDGDYTKAMWRCHGSIGNAMFYTSFTITAGFSILAISSFIPTVLFGLLTALAMLMALVAALSLLPRMVILFKPFGPGNQ